MGTLHLNWRAQLQERVIELKDTLFPANSDKVVQLGLQQRV